MKKHIPLPLLFVLIIIASIIIGVLALWAAYTIPVEPMQNNMISSAAIFEKEGLYPNYPSWAYSVLDNWTDAIMLQEAAFKNNLSPLVESMAVSRSNCNTGIPTDSIVNQYLYGQWSDWSETYERYWHGYLIFLKPLLLITDYSGLRILNTVLEIGFLFLISYLLWANKRSSYIVPYLLSVFCIRLLAIINCLGFSLVYYIFSISVVILLIFSLRNVSIRSYYILFLLIGISTAYFDVLAWPIATFGIPAAFYLCLNMSSDLKNDMKNLIILGISWFIGYSFMWAGKWLAGTVITGTNYFASALSQISEVTGTDKNFTYGYVVYNSLRDFVLNPAIILTLLYAAYLIISIVLNLKKGTPDKPIIRNSIILFGLLCIFPFFYMYVMKRHVGIHHFLFENKVLMITTFSGLCMLTKIKQLVSTSLVDDNLKNI